MNFKTLFNVFHLNIRRELISNQIIKLRTKTITANLSTQATSVKDTTPDESSLNINTTDPLKHADYFNVSEMFTMKDLYDARVHFGHKVGLRNEHMKPYLFGERLGCDIIDLEKTTTLLKEALNFTCHIARLGGIILFVSRHAQTLPLVERLARDCGEYSHCRPWNGGTFTNATVQYGAVTRLPDLVVFVNAHDSVFEPHTAIAESAKMNIPTIGVMDTACDPRLLTYPVPGNDDSPASIELYCRLFAEAIKRGKAAKQS